MEQLTFLFYAHVPRAQQDARLAEISHWPAVQHVSRLRPDISIPALQRICFVILEPNQSRDQLIEALMALKEVETAEPPVPRWLL